MKKPCLLITHGPNPPRDFVAQALAERGHGLEWRALSKGHSLPDPDPEAYALTVSYGGPQLLSELEPGQEYLLDEVAWTRSYVDAGGRFLGLCLGAQILAKAFDAGVWRHPNGCREIGYYPIQATNAGRSKFNFPSDLRVYHWHRDGFDVPEGGELLASGELFQNQAFTLNPKTLAVQFHPEITCDMIQNWADRSPPDSDQHPGAQCRTTHHAQFEIHQDRVRSWISDQLDALLAA